MAAIVDALFVTSMLLPPTAVLLGFVLLAWPRRHGGVSTAGAGQVHASAH